MTRPAVFFDRDGTICREVGYVNHPSRLELAGDAAAAIRTVNRWGWAAVVVTNQAGVARGYFPPHAIDEAHERLRVLLAREGATLDGIYTCMHHPDVGGPAFRMPCGCRKPKPGLLLAAARDLDLDLARSIMIGDSFKDVGAGVAAGVDATVLLRTGYGRGELIHLGHQAEDWPDRIADDLTEALDWIARRSSARELVRD